MNNSKIYKLFPMPLYTNLIDISEDQKQIIKDMDFERMPINNGDVTVNRYVLRDKRLEPLLDQIYAEVEEFLHERLGVSREIEFYMTNSWSIRHRKGDWAQEHDHKNSIISGVVYLQADDNSGNIHFLKPHWNANIFPQMFMVPYETRNQTSANTWTFKPETGQIILFPSSLPHEVEVSQSDNDRYVLAFNFFMRGTFGELEGQLELK